MSITEIDDLEARVEAAFNRVWESSVNYLHNVGLQP